MTRKYGTKNRQNYPLRATYKISHYWLQARTNFNPTSNHKNPSLDPNPNPKLYLPPTEPGLGSG